MRGWKCQCILIQTSTEHCNSVRGKSHDAPLKSGMPQKITIVFVIYPKQWDLSRRTHKPNRTCQYIQSISWKEEEEQTLIFSCSSPTLPCLQVSDLPSPRLLGLGHGPSVLSLLRPRGNFSVPFVSCHPLHRRLLVPRVELLRLDLWAST